MNEFKRARKEYDVHPIPEELTPGPRRHPAGQDQQP